jgi:DNA repair protein RecN (Recombination protein N)
MELTSSIYNKLYEGDDSVNDSLGEIQEALEELQNIDKSFVEIGGEFETVLTLIGDISKFMRDYNSRIDVDPGRLEEMRERLRALSLLKKKYGGSVKLIIEHRKKLGDEYDLAENYSGSIDKLEKDIKDLRVKCGAAAAKLSTKRKEISKKVQKEIRDVLSYLGIPDSVFNVNMMRTEADVKKDDYILADGKAYKYDSSGIDGIEFFISTNAGEDPKPLAKVASGGEISRIMLGLKTILAKNDKLPLLIFDEIDTGVSGRIAQKVGQALKSLADFHQIISITHLPQIAGLADHHFAVEKSKRDGRVVSFIKKLNDDERVKEVAKLMSGEAVTDASLKGARELMGQKK